MRANVAESLKTGSILKLNQTSSIDRHDKMDDTSAGIVFSPDAEIESQDLSDTDSDSQSDSDNDSDFSDCHLSEISTISRDKDGKPNELEICFLEKG